MERHNIASITLSGSRENVIYDGGYLEKDSPPYALNLYDKYAPIIRREISPLVLSILQGARDAANSLERYDDEKDKDFDFRRDEAASNFLSERSIVYRGDGVVAVTDDPGEPGVDLIISGSMFEDCSDVAAGKSSLASCAASLIRDCDATDKIIDALWRRQDPFIIPRIDGEWEEIEESKKSKKQSRKQAHEKSTAPVVQVTQIASKEKQGCVQGCASFLWLALFIGLILAYCTSGDKDSDAPKDAPEATAPATTPPTNETPQEAADKP